MEEAALLFLSVERLYLDGVRTADFYTHVTSTKVVCFITNHVTLIILADHTVCKILL